MERNGMHSFAALTDWSPERLTATLDLAVRLKSLGRAGRRPTPLVGRHLALIFQKPSLRTRLSFEVGFTQLGGHVTYTSPAEVGLGQRESVADVARVVGRYVDLIVARVFSHKIIEEMIEHAGVPVINGLSDYNHPCQIVSDLLTIREHRGNLDDLSVAWIGDGNNVAVSWINAARRLPIRVTLACPEGYDPDPATLAAARAEVGDRVRVVRDPKEAADGADVIYADTWYSMGQEEEKARRIRDFAGYTVDDALLACAKTDVLFLHCLPAHRGDEVTDQVIEGPRSRVFDQAENRLHAQKAIMLMVMALDCAIID